MPSDTEAGGPWGGSSQPPAVPPPLPVDAGLVFEGRLHPLTLLFRGWQLLRGVLLPAIIVLYFGRNQFLGYFLLLFFIGPMGMSIIRYFTFTFKITAEEIVLRHGLIGRTERHIPLTRVQDVRLEQGVLHRLLGMADVEVETAGGQGVDASLSVLSKSHAEELRRMIFAQRETARAVVGAAGGVALDLPPLQESGQIVRQVSMRELILAGITSNKLASIVALLVVVQQLAGDFVSETSIQKFWMTVTQQGERWVQGGLSHHWMALVLAAVGLLILGVLGSTITSVVVFYRFTLSRSGEDLHRSYGLLTRRSSSLPRRRIQVLKVEEKFLRRLFRLVTLRADTAGGGHGGNKESSSGRDVLLPVVPRDEVQGLLPAFFPDWSAELFEWQQVSRRAILRGTVKGAWFCVALTAVTVWRRPDWISLWPLLLIIPIYVLNVMSYRHLGYAVGRRYFQTRRGWLGRDAHIVPIRNIQSVVLRQMLFDRRHRVASLRVDTAGQAFTGGGPHIDNVPVQTAVEVARRLAQSAAATRYRW